MNESKRQAYLEAMDIQTYFPRQQLPGAKPSPVYDFPVIKKLAPELHESTQSQTARAPQVAKKAIGLDAIEELRSRAPAGRKTSDTPARREAEAAPPTNEADANVPAVAPENNLSFTLRYYRVSEKLAVLAEVPPQGSQQLGDDSLALLHGILRAVGESNFSSSSKVEEFSWPLHSGYSMKNSPEVEAAKAISGFLQMRQETDGFANLLVFAGQLEEVLLPKGASEAARDFENGKGYITTVTHSLASMLAVPTLKRDVWQHLQPLRKRIESSS